MIKFLTGAAALALAASAVHADPGGGKGQGGGKDKGGGHEAHAMQAAQGGGRDQAKAQGGGNARGPEMRGGGKPDRVDQGNGKSAQARVERSDNGNRGAQRANARDDRGRDVVQVRDRRDVVIRDSRDRFDWDDIRSRGLVDGCPPGLAKKSNGCMPPGLARDRRAGFATFWDRPSWWGLSGLGDGRYAYYDGSLMRLGDGGRVLGYLPLLGGALAPGNLWPSYYQPVSLPNYYQDYYGLGPVANYRYYDDAIYGVDPQTRAITSIAALLTGDNFAIGQPMPVGYGLYNVPYSYRDRYIDGPDALYRYSDGYVYQVDPETRLIAAAIELLT